MDTRKLIGTIFLGLSGMIMMTTLVVMLISPNTSFEEWYSFLIFTVLNGVTTLIGYHPRWNGQYLFDFKQKKMVWKSKRTGPDVGHRRFMSLCYFVLSLSMMSMAGIMNTLYPSSLFEVVGGVAVVMIVIAVALVIWTEVWLTHKGRKNSH